MIILLFSMSATKKVDVKEWFYVQAETFQLSLRYLH